jgi:hypothetical protein
MSKELGCLESCIRYENIKEKKERGEDEKMIEAMD